MAYTKQTWTNGVSKLNATRMQHIEDGLEAAATVADDATTTADAAIPSPASPSTNDGLFWDGSAWVADTINNAKIAAGAAIAYSKLNLSSSIVDADISTSAAISPSKLAIPSARAYHNAAQSITNITLTVLSLNSERFDTDSIHDTVTNNSRLTCKTAGKYLVVGNVEFAANGTGLRLARIRLNGSTSIAQLTGLNVGGSDAFAISVSTIYDLAVNDYVELLAYQSSGGALNVNSTANMSPEFMMVRVG